MPRDDHERRRLRGLYDRNKRRVSALADARDKRRSGNDDEVAPRRFMVSERRTRVEGFGRGGTQIRRVVRITREGGRAPRRFSDRGIFRRGARDRFRRDDDFDREMRRERFFEERSGRGRRGGERRRIGGGDRFNGREVDVMRGGARSFGLSRRRRLRMRESRRGDGPRNNDSGRDGGSRRGRRGGSGKDNNNNNSNRSNNNGNYRSNNNNNNGNNRNNNGNNRNSNSSRNNSINNNKQNQHQQGGRNGGRGSGRARDPALTRDQLDAQLDSYRNN